VPDAHTVADIRLAVQRTHEATMQASALLNLHIRRCLADSLPIGEDLFDANYLLKAFYEVTMCNHPSRPLQPDAALAATAARYMSNIRKLPRDGLTQIFLFNATNMAATASTNVWLHFQKRLLKYIKVHYRLSRDAYAALTKEEKKARSLQLLRIAADIRASPDAALTSEAMHHDFVANQRAHLGIDEAVQDWDGKPLLYHLKATPHRFVAAMSKMSKYVETMGCKGFALFPLRRKLVPGFIRFDAVALQKALQSLKNERENRRSRKRGSEGFTFANTLDYRGAKISQRWRIEDGFMTDGVSVRLKQLQGSREAVTRQRLEKAEANVRKQEARKRKRDEKEAGVAHKDRECSSRSKKKEKETPAPLQQLPRRGIWAIDQIKHLSRSTEVQIIGIDPGKVELVVATDLKDTKAKAVRYTLQQRRRDMRTRQYADMEARSRPGSLKESFQALSQCNSHTADLRTFRKYVAERQNWLSEGLLHYSAGKYRHRRWKTYIKAQKSEQTLYDKLQKMQKGDKPMVIAYGAWGLVSGRTGACNKGNPPAIGVGLMRKIARRFLVVPTPEAYTSKTCHKCLGACGPHPTMRTAQGREIRGLRVCQNEGCKAHLNRDINASRNIGLQLERLLDDKPLIHELTEEDIEFNEHRLCVACEE